MNSSLTFYISGFFARYINCCIVFIVCGLLGYPAYAAESGAANSEDSLHTGNRFGVIGRIKGEVIVESDGSGHARPLHEGSPVYVGDHIRSAVNSEAVINTEDAGRVAVRPNTQFFADHFAAEGKKTDNMTLRLVTGSMRVITGWIGHVNRAEDRIITPTTTIGIRGTDHEPYVLPAELAASTKYLAGTYDKVNRGETTLGEGDQLLEINAGRVGFAPSSTFEAKGLMTILMPVLLDKVPDFYVPGQFDTELDKYSKTAETESDKQFEKKSKTKTKDSGPIKIAQTWLDSFDDAVVKRDAHAIIDLFSSDVLIQANVRKANGEMTAVLLGREEMAKSTIAAVKGLKNYQQRRLTLDAEQVTSCKTLLCNRISMRSAVIEQGEQSGRPYRFESTEDYLLELREGKWLAIKAETTQR